MKMIKVNETLLRSIVTQPWNENYVYAWNFSSLSLVKNVVLSKTCKVVTRPTTTRTSTFTTLLAVTSSGPFISTLTTITPALSTTSRYFNGIREVLLST